MYRLLILLVLFSACGNDQSTSTEWRTLDLKAFKIDVPPSWKYNPVQGIDSYVGEIIDGIDTLFFDFGWYSPAVGSTELKNQLYTSDTINGMYAIISIPKNDSDGYIEMSISNFKNGKDKFYIAGGKLQNKNRVLKIIKSIRFPESDTTLNPILTMEKFSKSNFINGRTVFQYNCASCHHPLKDATGPALRGVINKHSIKWLVSFFTNRKELEKDTAYQRIVGNNIYPDCFNFPDLTKQEVEALRNYLVQERSGCSLY